MAFDIRDYHKKNIDYYGDDTPLEEVGRDIYTRGGYDKRYPDFNEFTKAAGIDQAIQEDRDRRKPKTFLDKLREGTASVAPGLEEIPKGLEAGVKQVKGMGYGLTALAGAATGSDTLARIGAEGLERVEAETPKPAVGSISEIENLSDVGKYLAYGVTSNLPNMLLSLLGGGVGGVIGKKVGTIAAEKILKTAGMKTLEKKAAKEAAAKTVRDAIKRGAVTGAVTSSIGMEAGSIAGDQLTETGEVDVGKTLAGAIPAGLLDVVPEWYLAKKLGWIGKGAAEFTGNRLTRAAKVAGSQFAMEAPTEAMQSVIERSSVPGKSISNADAWDEYINSFILGGMTGAVVGGAGGIFTKKAEDLTPEQNDQLEQMKKGAILSTAIHIGMETGKLGEDSFTADDAVKIIGEGRKAGIYTKEDVERFKDRYPALKSGLNDVIVEDLKEQITQYAQEMQKDVPESLGESIETSFKEIPAAPPGTVTSEPDVLEALKTPTIVPVKTAVETKRLTKETLTAGLGTGEIAENSPVRLTTVDELRTIIEQGKLKVGEDFEGTPGISAQRINKETPIVAYGANNKISAAIIFPDGAIESTGNAPNEVKIKPGTKIEDLRFVIDGHEQILTLEDLRKIYEGEGGPEYGQVQTETPVEGEVSAPEAGEADGKESWEDTSVFSRMPDDQLKAMADQGVQGAKAEVAKRKGEGSAAGVLVHPKTVTSTPISAPPASPVTEKAPETGKEPSTGEIVQPGAKLGGPNTPVRENGGYTSIIMDDGTALIGGKIHGETYDMAVKAGFPEDKVGAGMAGFTRPDGTTWNLQGKFTKAQKVINLDDLQPGATSGGLDPVFTDIHREARRVAREDALNDTQTAWLRGQVQTTSGPGMPNSPIRKQWDLAYTAERNRIEAERSVAGGTGEQTSTRTARVDTGSGIPANTNPTPFKWNGRPSQPVIFTAGEYKGMTGKVIRQTQKRYSKEADSLLVQVDGFPKPGGWDGRVHVSPAVLKESPSVLKEPSTGEIVQPGAKDEETAKSLAELKRLREDTDRLLKEGGYNVPARQPQSEKGERQLYVRGYRPYLTNKEGTALEINVAGTWAKAPKAAVPETKAAEEKELWQMTREEWNAKTAEQPATEAYEHFHPDEMRRNTIKQALSEGKPVPPEVLKDYPDLVAKPVQPPMEAEGTRGTVEKPPAAPTETRAETPYKVGDRVVVDGKHGAISLAETLVIRPIFGAGAESRQSVYRVKLDSGREIIPIESHITRETERPTEAVIPDVLIPKEVFGKEEYLDPGHVVDSIQRGRKRAAEKREAANRARSHVNRVRKLKEAKDEEELNARLQSAFNAWAEKNPEAAEKYRPVKKAEKAVAGNLSDFGLNVNETTTNKGTPVWNVSGNTREHMDVIKSLGGKWYRPKQVWSFYDGDPTGKLLEALGEKKVAPAVKEGVRPEPTASYTIKKEFEEENRKQIEGYSTTGEFVSREDLGNNWIKLTYKKKAPEAVKKPAEPSATENLPPNITQEQMQTIRARLAVLKGYGAPTAGYDEWVKVIESGNAEKIANEPDYKSTLNAINLSIARYQREKAEAKTADIPIPFAKGEEVIVRRGDQTFPATVLSEGGVNWVSVAPKLSVAEASKMRLPPSLQVEVGQVEKAPTEVKPGLTLELLENAKKEALGDALTGINAAIADFKRGDHEGARLLASKAQAQTATDLGLGEAIKKTSAAPFGSQNKIFTEDKANKAREILRKKLGGIHMGVPLDPEVIQAGIDLAGYYIEGGARTFADYSKKMIGDLGDVVRAYLKSFYMAVRNYPGFDKTGMDNEAALDEIDENVVTPEDKKALMAVLKEGDRVYYKSSTEKGIGAGEFLANKGTHIYLRGGASTFDVYPEQIIRAENDAGPIDITKKSVKIESREGGETHDTITGNVAQAEGAARHDQGRPPGEIPEPVQRAEEDREAVGVPAPEGTRPDAELRGGEQQAPGQTGERGEGVRGGKGVQHVRVPPVERRPGDVAGVSRNYRISDGELTRTGSWKDAAKTNLDIIELVKRLDDEKRAATPEEQALLLKYVGWGSSELANNMFPGFARTGELRPSWQHDESWRVLVDRLESLLTPEQIKTAARSTQYAHYTSEAVIRSIYKGLERIGFKGGRVLEPGMGIGHFAGLLPWRSTYTGIEMDSITAKIAQYLYPKHHVKSEDFTKTVLPDNFFDLSVGNPPFASTVILSDPAFKKNRFKLHEYFIAKSLAKTKPGGLAVFISSRYAMDKVEGKFRDYVAEMADLLGAIRLPQTAFKQNAGTEVVTDVMFFRKRLPGEHPSGQAWQNLKEIQTDEGPVNINEYFVDHPEMVLGKNSLTGSMYREKEYTVLPMEGNIEEHFAEAVQKLPEGVYDPSKLPADDTKNAVIERDFSPANKKEGGLYIGKDGIIMRTEFGAGTALSSIKKLSPKDALFLKDYIPLRDALKKAQYDQLMDGDWETSLKQLNKAYKDFVKKHGNILTFSVYEKTETDEDGNKKTVVYRRYKYDKLLMKDVENSLVRALEFIDDNGDIQKGPVLNGRTIRPPAKPEIKTAADALAVALDNKGALDLDYVASLIGETREAVIEQLGDLLYEDPAKGYILADEYLSGDVVKKLDEARAAAATDKKYERNVKALEQAQPVPLTPENITVNLGANWIPTDYYNDFLQDVIGVENLEVSYRQSDNTWTVASPAQEEDSYYYRRMRRRVKKQSLRSAKGDWGTEDRGPNEILEAILNNRTIKIMRTERFPDGSTHTYLDQPATAKVNDVVRKMREAFKSWVWTDAKRANDLLTIYNRKYNNLAGRKFDGRHLSLPGFTSIFKPHDHQKRAIWRIIQSGNTYLAHAVGAGKTMEMIAAGMEMKRLGMISKPVYVVPKHMLQQFANEFQLFYPMAHVMVADEVNFHTENRRRFIAQAALNNPDAIVITHPSLVKLKMKEENIAPVRDAYLQDMRDTLQELQEDTQGNRIRIKQMENRIEQAEQRFDAMVSGEAKDSAVTFEELGADFLFVDEAHNFRKLDFVTNRQVKGIDPVGSVRAMDLYIKSLYLERKNPGRSHVFASGTPVVNTMGELYTIMKFFSEKKMDEEGMHHFDAWANNFGIVTPDYELNAAGRYEIVERFSKFVNIPELMSRVREFTDVLTMSQLGQFVKRPAVKGGQPTMQIAQASEALKSYQKDVLLARINASRAWKPSPGQPGNPDPLINIITDGRLASIDMRFVVPDTENDPKSKLNLFIDGIIQSYKDTTDMTFTDPETGKEEATKGGTQIVFYNLGFGEQVSKNRGFDARAWAMKRFKEAGIPANHIAWIDDYKTAQKKEVVFKEMRQGKKRILIGSAKKMGTGMNVQRRLANLHYLDAPWYPADVEQPEGRILRQGNLNEEVGIYRYATKGSYDATMWQMVTRKAKMNEQAWQGDKNVRTAEDMSPAGSYAIAYAMSSGDERTIQLVGLQADITRLGRLKEAHEQQQLALRQEKRERESNDSSYRSRLADLKEAKDKVPGYIRDIEGKIGNTTYDNREEFGQKILERRDALNAEMAKDNKALKEGAKLKIAELNGFPIYLVRASNYVNVANTSTPMVSITDKVSETFDVTSDSDPRGLVTKMVNFLNGIDRKVGDLEEGIEANKREIAAIDKKIGAPFEYANELAEKIAEEARLKAELASEGEKTEISEEEAQRLLEEKEARERAEEVQEEQYSTTPTAPGWSLSDVQEIFKGQEVVQTSPNGPIFIRMSGGKFLTINSVDRISPKEVNFRLAYGREIDKENETITGAYGEGNIRLVRGKAGKWTLHHESVHALIDAGIISEADYKLLSHRARILVKFGKMKGANKEQIGGEEDVANLIADIRAGEREEGTAIGRIVQKILDFIDNIMAAFGKRTAGGVVRDLESGEIFRREGGTRGRGEQYSAAWHGSPHTFARFDTGKIGTGEGAQAYGYGLYFAGKKEVAEYYKKALGGMADVFIDGEKVGRPELRQYAVQLWSHLQPSQAMMVAQTLHDHLATTGSVDQTRREIQELKNSREMQLFPDTHWELSKELELLDNLGDRVTTGEPKGRLYQVELAPAEDEYLLWDAPLSEQSEKVKEALKDAFDIITNRTPNHRRASELSREYEKSLAAGYQGDRLYGTVGDLLSEITEDGIDNTQKAASDYLHSLGIRGIKYLDAASRGKGEGHYNYVIFSDKDVSITEMYSVEKILNNPVGYKKASKEVSGSLKDKIRNEKDLLIQELVYQTTPDIHKLGNLKKFLTSPEWYEHPVFSKIVRLFTRDREELFNEYYNHLTNLEQPMMEENTVGELALKLKHKGLSMAERLSGETSKEYQDVLRIIDEADINNVTYSEENLKKQGYSEDTIAVWKGFRESYDKALDLLTAQMRAMIEAIEEEAAFKGIKPVDYSEMYETLKGALAQMGDLRGSYAPRTRQGNWAVTASRGDEENREYYREHRFSHMAAKRLARSLEAEGWTIDQVKEVDRLSEDVYQDLKTVSVAKAIETAIDNMTKGKGEETQNQAVKFNEEILREVADMIRARGFRSTMIRRTKGAGVIKGYIEDPIERHSIYTSNVSRGLAKAKVAGKAMELFAGTKEKGEQVGGINPKKEPQIYSAAKDYIEEQLRNMDRADRTIAWAKSLASLKFLGFSARSAVVNLTAIVTTAPASIHQYVTEGRVSFGRINKALALAGKDSAKFMTGKFQGDKDEMLFLNEQKRLGWDNPQYTRDMIAKIGSTGNRAWAMTMDGAMWMFGKTEQWNRLTTMLAAYRLARASGKDHAQASELAKTASDKAHGIYGRSTLPSIAWGRNPAAKMAQMLYTFSKFAHNYMQLLYDLGFRKHNWKAFSYALLAPVLLSGVSAWPLKDAVFMPLIGVLLSILGIKDRDRDTEKWIWDLTRKYLGTGAEGAGRYGAMGALGFDISGSLSIGVGLPKNIWEWGGAIGGVVKEGSEALDELGQGNTGRAVEKLLPSGLANPLRAVREAGEGISTQNKRRVWDESGKPFMPVSSETARRAFGFRSTRQAVLSQRTWEGHRQQARFTEMRNEIYEQFRSWLLSGGKDRARYAKIIKEAREYNAKIRDLGIQAEVPPITTQAMRNQMKRTHAPSKRERALLM